MTRGKHLKNSAQRRIAVISVALIVFTALLMTLFSWLYYTRFTAESCTADANRFRETFAELETYIDYGSLKPSEGDAPKEDDVYEGFRTYLKRLCAESGTEYIFMFHAKKDEGKIRYIMAVADDNEQDEIVREERSYNTEVMIEDYSYINKALDGELAGPRRVSNEFGRVLTYYFPVYNDKGEITCIAGIDFDVSEVTSRAIGYVIRMVALVTGVLTAVMIMLLIVLRKKIFKPLRHLAEQMNSFEPESEHVRLDLRSYYEIEEINNSFSKMSDDIAGYIVNIKAMEHERTQAAAELDIARRIQNGMVPLKCSHSGRGYDLYASACPAREVGGDFYDVFESGGRICAVIGDVSGKGIAAALFMAMAKNMIKNKLRSELDPAAALNFANNELCAENPEGMFVTVFALVLDTSTGEVVFANGGHTRPLISGKDGSRFLSPDSGIALGLFEDSHIINEFTVLADGECITVYTDGVTEAVSVNKELFGEDRLQSEILPGSAEETARSVSDAVKRYSEGCEQSDDITLVSLRFTRSENFVSELLPCEMSSLGRMQSRLMELADGYENKRMIVLACEELLVNIVTYSGSEYIGMIMSREDDRLTVRFEDSGKPFDPLAEPPKEKDFDDCDTGGMGINIALQLSDTRRYSYISGKNIINMTFLLS